MNSISVFRLILIVLLLIVALPEKGQCASVFSSGHKENIAVLYNQPCHSASDSTPQMPIENKEKENEKERERERESETKNKGETFLLNLFVCYTLFNTCPDFSSTSLLLFPAGSGTNAISHGNPLFLSVRNIRV